MSLPIPRRNYVVYILDSRPERAEPTAEILRAAGYRPTQFAEYRAMSDAVVGRPPHVILFHRSDEANRVGDSLKELRERLPETHFLVLSSAAGLTATWREWGDWIYDCVLTPPVHSQQLVKAVDRAAERDVYMYRGEDLEEKIIQLASRVPQPAPAEPVATQVSEGVTGIGLKGSIDLLERETEAFVSAVLAEVQGDAAKTPALPVQDAVAASGGGTQLPLANIWRRLTSQRQMDGLIREAVTIMAELVSEGPIVFLRNLPNRRCLVTSAAQRLAPESWQGMGLDLSQEPEFRLSDLRHPEKLASLRELAHSVIGAEHYWTRPLEVRDEVFGLFVIFAPLFEIPLAELELVMNLTAHHARLLDLEQYVHAVQTLDPATQVLSRPHLIQRLQGEVARARRLESPTALLIISLDQYREILRMCGVEEAQTALRALAKIIQPRSRINDTLGRIGADELGLILPHTNAEGGAIKAERLRKLIAAADFSRLLPQFPQMTVSIGVSEYPSCCRDVDDLVATADDALWQVKNKVANKVCIATAVAGFTPDFNVSK